MKLYENGKSCEDIAGDYDITLSALDRWIKNYKETGLFAAKDTRTEEDSKLARLGKENQRLLMDNAILKQAALIMGRT